MTTGERARTHRKPRLLCANVNSTSFGKLFTDPVDGIIVGHPLYLPNVNIPGQGLHNVVYVCTMHDSVYAFDADNGNPTPLWMTSIFTYSPAGATAVPATVKKETGNRVDRGRHHLYSRDRSCDRYSVPCCRDLRECARRASATCTRRHHRAGKFGGPTTITATNTLNGTTTTFADLYEINRPGLLLTNGHVYIGFGSNCCNNYSQGWVLSYNATTLQQEGTYTAEPGKTLASIWQKGAGLSADSNGNIYARNRRRLLFGGHESIDKRVEGQSNWHDSGAG